MIKDLFKICKCKNCGHNISYETSDIIHQEGFAEYNWDGRRIDEMFRIEELSEYVRKMKETKRIGYISDIKVIKCPNCEKYIIL